MVLRWISLGLIAMFAVVCLGEWGRSYERTEGVRIAHTTLEVCDGAIYYSSRGTGVHWFFPFSIKGMHGGTPFPELGAKFFGFYAYLKWPDFSLGVPFWALVLGAVAGGWKVWERVGRGVSASAPPGKAARPETAQTDSSVRGRIR